MRKPTDNEQRFLEHLESVIEAYGVEAEFNARVEQTLVQRWRLSLCGISLRMDRHDEIRRITYQIITDGWIYNRMVEASSHPPRYGSDIVRRTSLLVHDNARFDKEILALKMFINDL